MKLINGNAEQYLLEVSAKKIRKEMSELRNCNKEMVSKR